MIKLIKGKQYNIYPAHIAAKAFMFTPLLGLTLWDIDDSISGQNYYCFDGYTTYEIVEHHVNTNYWVIPVEFKCWNLVVQL